MAQALRIAEDGEVTEVTWTQERQLQALQQGVGGLVDLVALTPEVDM